MFIKLKSSYYCEDPVVFKYIFRENLCYGCPLFSILTKTLTRTIDLKNSRSFHEHEGKKNNHSRPATRCVGMEQSSVF